MESVELGNATDSNCDHVISIEDQAGNQLYTENALQMTQVLDVMPEGVMHVDGTEVIQLGTGEDILQTDGEGMLNPARIQYVVIQRPYDYGDVVIQTPGNFGDSFSVDDSCVFEQTADINQLLEQSHKQGTDRFQCGLCEHVCETVLQFLQHKATHLGRGLGLGCEICRLSFSRQLAIMEHYRRKHRIFFVEKNSKPELKSPKIAKADKRKSKNLKTENSENKEKSHLVCEIRDTERTKADVILKDELNIDSNAVGNNGDILKLETSLGNLKSILKKEENSEMVHLKENQFVGSAEKQLHELNPKSNLLNYGHQRQVLIQEISENQKSENNQSPEIIQEDSENITSNDDNHMLVAFPIKLENVLANNDQNSDAFQEVTEKQVSENNQSSVTFQEESEEAMANGDPNSDSDLIGEVPEYQISDDHNQRQDLIEDTQNSLPSHNMEVHQGNDTSNQVLQVDNVNETPLVRDHTKTVFVTVASRDKLKENNMQSIKKDRQMKSLLNKTPKGFLNEAGISKNNSEKENTLETLEKENADSENVLEDDQIDNLPLNNNNIGRRRRKRSFNNADGATILTIELNMPDFHFISVIEENLKSSLKGGRYNFQCLYCATKVSWRSTMCRHMREKHADMLKMEPYFCIVTPTTVEGQRVMKMSEYIKLERSQHSTKRIRGIETQDLPGDFPCDKCDKLFHRLRYLKKHQVLHKSEKNLLCTICVKSFKTVANLNQHMKTHRDREAYKCGECEFESSINIAIHTHRQVHSKGCVLCDICGCAYNDKSTLAKHKQVHDPQRPFACQYLGCTWRFKTKNICNAHFRAHTTKGKFECHVCGYAFRQKHHLQRHERKVHNIVPEKKPSYRYLDPDELEFEDNTKDNENNNDNDEDDHLDQNEGQNVHNGVSLIPNHMNEESKVQTENVDDHFDLESAIQNGQLVIATDDGNTIPVNYEMSDIGMNVEYHTLLHDGDGQHLDAHTILIPQTVGSHIVYQHEETITSEVEIT